MTKKRFLKFIVIALAFLLSCQTVTGVKVFATAVVIGGNRPENDGGAVASKTPADGAPETTPEPLGGVEHCASVVAEMRALIDAQTLPEHFQEEDPPRLGTEFDANRFFDVLTHLSMREGYALDYIYYYDGMGGFPVLFAREDDLSLLETNDAYQSAVAVGVADPEWQEYVEADGTPESFIELVVLRIMAKQFYLFWHANYDDAQIVCDQQALDGLVEMIENDEYGSQDMTRQHWRTLDKLDPSPQVKIKGNRVEVRVIVFSNWGGFYEYTYTFQQEAPHELLDSETENLVPYDCGIMF